MSKVTRKNLTRGVRLTRQHVYTPMTAVAAELTNVNINRENLLKSWAPFRINFHVPWLDGKYFENSDTLRFTIPFTLPPLQEFFSTAGLPTETTPPLVLDEFSISFDQRAEPVAIASRFDGAPVNAGKMFPAALPLLDLGVALLEKRQWIYDNNTPMGPDTEIFSTDLPAEIWGGTTVRDNPFIINDLNRTVSPYRTYVLVLDASDMWTTDQKIMLPSLQFSLRLWHPLVDRDAGVNYVQNIPTSHAGAKVGPTITINAPASNTPIEADTADGVQTNNKLIDQALQAKLGGGYWRDSDVDPTESIETDAAYDVLVVPVWSGYGHKNVISAEDASSVPNLSGGGPDPEGSPYVAIQQDEVSIPLPWPLTVHHVTLAVNHQAPGAGAGGASGGLHPTSATFRQGVAVGLGVGRKSDLYTYQDIAHCQWDLTDVATITIDRLLGVKYSSATGEPLGSATQYDWELLHCPITTGPQGAGVGYYAQGTPFFAGLATSRSMERSDVGDGVPVTDAPNTEGQEQFLQVHWWFQDANGLSDTGAAPPGAAGSPEEVYVGYSGHFVQIVTKKHLCRIGLDVEIPVGG